MADLVPRYSSADCLTPKGFTFMRLKLAEGVFIDAVNLHADAGYAGLPFYHQES
jgi:hypothetical protein